MSFTTEFYRMHRLQGPLKIFSYLLSIKIQGVYFLPSSKKKTKKKQLFKKKEEKKEWEIEWKKREKKLNMLIYKCCKLLWKYPWGLGGTKNMILWKIYTPIKIIYRILWSSIFIDIQTFSPRFCICQKGFNFFFQFYQYANSSRFITIFR